MIVADNDGEVLGFIALHALPRFEHSDRVVRVMALVVDAGVRDRGVGHLLMEEAERIGRELGAAFAEVTAGHHRRRRPAPLRVARLRRRRSRPTSGSGSDDALTPRRSGSSAAATAAIDSPPTDVDVPAPPPPRPGDRPRRAAVGAAARRLAGRRRSPSGSCRSARRGTSSASCPPTASLYALKELPLEAGRREYDVLLHLEGLGLPAVEPGRHRRGAGPRTVRSSPRSTSPTRSSTGG